MTNLSEVSPNSLSGSVTEDLVLSKLWLLKKLKKFKKEFSTIYILGSWYGNMSIMLMLENIEFDHIVNVDKNPKVVIMGQYLARKLNVDDLIEPMITDANTLDYQQLDHDGLVINTSTDEIGNNGWFDNIPDKMMVAIQSRNDNLSEYHFSKTLYQGKIDLQDPEEKYTRYMKIGIK
jgi:hypothetical protein